MSDQFKIISNPYKKTIKFMKWENRGQQWSEYDNERSDLLNTKYEKGFFPFYVEEIIKVIVKEISDPEKGLTIHFEGTSDEYHELEAVCSKYLNIKGLRVKRSKKRLENARDILPDVNILFKEMTPVIEKALIGNKDYNLMHQKLERFQHIYCTKNHFILAIVGHFIWDFFTLLDRYPLR